MSEHQLLQWVKEELDEIKRDVKILVADKHKRAGAIWMISTFVSIVVTLLGLWVKL